MKALILGGVSIDTMIYTPEIKNISSDMSVFASKTTQQLGGTGAGKAMTMGKFASKTVLISQAKQEDHKFLERIFKDYNVQAKFIASNKTEKHTNIMHGENHRLSIFTSFPEDSEEINRLVTKEMLEEADLIFLNINSFCKKLIPRLYPYKEKVVVDLHDYKVGSSYHQDFLDVGSYLFTSCVYLKEQPVFLQSYMQKYNLTTNVITCNKEGAIGMDQTNLLKVSKALEGIKVVDSNGAGDAFVVGFMVEYRKSNNLEESLKFGNVCGAFSCESEALIDVEIQASDIFKKYKEL